MDQQKCQYKSEKCINKNGRTCNLSCDLSMDHQKCQNKSVRSCDTTSMDEHKCQDEVGVNSDVHAFINNTPCYRDSPEKCMNKNDGTCNLCFDKSMDHQKCQNKSEWSYDTTSMDEHKCEDEIGVNTDVHVFVNNTPCYQDSPLNYTTSNANDDIVISKGNSGEIQNQNIHSINFGRINQNKKDVFNDITPGGSCSQHYMNSNDKVLNLKIQQDKSGIEISHHSQSLDIYDDKLNSKRHADTSSIEIPGQSSDLNLEYEVSNHGKEDGVLNSAKNGSSSAVVDEDLMNYYSSLTRQLVMKEFGKSKNKRFICEVCGKQYSDTYSLNVHMKLHTGENLHKCDICGKMFTLSSNLTAHMRLHSGEKPFKCDECGNEYNQSGDLLRHKRTHTGERPFVCQICGKGFIRAEHCKTHQTVHTGLKEHECDVCGKSFSHIGHLRTHVRIHSGEKPFHCEICGKDFTHSSDRNKHAVVHSTEKPHKCQYCDKRFGRKDCKNRHEKTHFKS